MTRPTVNAKISTRVNDGHDITPNLFGKQTIPGGHGIREGILYLISLYNINMIL